MSLFETPTATAAPATDHWAVSRTLLEIRKYRLSTGQEVALHGELERVLAELLPGEAVEREVKIGDRDRIDFYLPRVKIGIECKVKGEVDDVLRQLARYALSPQIDSLLLVTGRMRHMPVFGRMAEIGNKPFRAIAIGGQLL